MRRRGFTLIELVVTFAVTSVLLLLVVKGYNMYRDTLAKSARIDMFNRLSQILEDSFKRNFAATTLTPLAVVKPDSNIPADGAVDLFSNNFIYPNAEVILFSNMNNLPDFSSIQLYSSDPDILQRQLEFLSLNTKLKLASDEYFVLVSSHTSSYHNIIYPYKNVLFLDLGRDLTRYYKRWNNEERKLFFTCITEATAAGFKVNNFFKINSSVLGEPCSLYNSSYTKGDFLRLFNSDTNKALDIWASLRSSILTYNFSTGEKMRDIVKNSVDTMELIAKNIEDWATIQARRAAYDDVSSGGNNLDRDYFITCNSSGCSYSDVIDNSYSTVYIDKQLTLQPTLSDSLSDEKVDEMTNSSDFGLFIADDNNIIYPITDASGCIDYDNGFNGSIRDMNNIPIINGSNVVNAVPLEIELALNPSCRYSKTFLSSVVAGFTKNGFGLPIFISNVPSSITYYAVDNSSISGVANDSFTIKVDLNIPTKNRSTTPPYPMVLYTLFSYIRGGLMEDITDYYANNNGSLSGFPEIKYYDQVPNYGFYKRLIFAHIN